MHRLPRRDPLLSRPQVSDDNPFSEAQFKTLKYHRFPLHQGQAKTFWIVLVQCRTAMAASRC